MLQDVIIINIRPMLKMDNRSIPDKEHGNRHINRPVNRNKQSKHGRKTIPINFNHELSYEYDNIMINK